MEDVQVSVVGGTGSGGLESGMAETAPGQPDVRLNIVSPLIAIGVRFGHSFLVSFVGVLTAAGIGGADILAATDFSGVVRTGAWIALSVGGMGLLKDLVTVFGRLEGKYPLISGSI